MSKNIVLFSGQGSQYAGMAKDFYDNYECAKAVFAAADEALGYKLEDIMFAEDPAELNKTIHSQPAIMACSLCAFEVLKEKGVKFEGVAGHSLGEYAAMAASGMLSCSDAFKLIKIRAQAMQTAAENSEGSMYAVIGPEPSEIEAACEKTEGYVVPVNYNSPVQTVIAGTAAGIEKAKEALSAKGAKRIVPLAVSAAFHSRLMAGASEEFAVKVKDIPFSTPSMKFYCNVYGNELTDFSDMPAYLAKHICSPVRFTSELDVISKDGYDTYIELGPGKVLTGLVKKTLDGVTAVNVENIDTLEKAAAL